MIEQILSEISVSLFLTDVMCLFKGAPPPNLAQEDVQSKSYTLLSKSQLESEIPQVSITMTYMSTYMRHVGVRAPTKYDNFIYFDNLCHLKKCIIDNKDLID